MADLISMLAAASGGAVAESDPNFKQTVLLLHGDGTNGAQNNTFLDGSTNNFTITRNGNTTQGTFSPFSGPNGYWSNYLDGNDWIQVADNSALELGSGDFTIEAWVYFTPSNLGGANSGIAVVSKWNASNYSYLASFFNDGGTWKLNFSYSTNGSSATNVRVTAGLAANVWYHVAYVRSGSSLKMFLDGVEKTTTETISGTLFDGNEPVAIGRTGDGFNYATGYFSNVRIVKGTAVYTSSFTPPTTPLTAITNTSLLTCQSNRFVDNSTNAFAITRNGDVKVTPFSPFAPTAAYSASTNGGSGYFDGTGDYLSVADAAGLRFGTGNFTIQAWIYRSAAGAVHSIAAKGGASTGWVFQVHSDNKLRFTQTTTNIDSTGTIPAGAWTHVAVVREGTGTNQTKLYINGVNDGQATVTTDFNQTEQLNIGADRGNANPMNGYISGFKYVVGTAETITVPTAPPTGGTALLNFTNAGILDNTGKNNLETVGNAQIDTTTKKFGTGSMEFDGTGDRLLAAPSPDLDLSVGDFTVECWVYFNSVSGDANLCNRGGQSISSGADLQWSLYRSGTSLFVRPYQSTTDFSINVGTVTTSTWYHVALTRSGSTCRGFLNGTVSGTTRTVSGALNNNAAWYGVTIGNLTVGGTDQPMNGFIDDLRITKGVARYTANFTAPTKAFPDQ